MVDQLGAKMVEKMVALLVERKVGSMGSQMAA